MTKNPFQKFIAMLSEDRRDILYLYAYALFYALVNLSLPLGVQAIVGPYSSRHCEHQLGHP